MRISANLPIVFVNQGRGAEAESLKIASGFSSA